MVPFSPRSSLTASVDFMPMRLVSPTLMIRSLGLSPAFSAGAFLMGETMTIRPSRSSISAPMPTKEELMTSPKLLDSSRFI
ncbi:hypothetical protein D3C75_1335810 [compost metagenome]